MERIKHAFYINLESRPDRREHVERQLSLVGVKNAQRFNAIKLPNGAIGCSMSHLKCLETALANDWEHVLIVEDDILFLKPNRFVAQFNKVRLLLRMLYFYMRGTKLCYIVRKSG